MRRKGVEAVVALLVMIVIFVLVFAIALGFSGLLKEKTGQSEEYLENVMGNITALFPDPAMQEAIECVYYGCDGGKWNNVLYKSGCAYVYVRQQAKGWRFVNCSVYDYCMGAHGATLGGTQAELEGMTDKQSLCKDPTTLTQYKVPRVNVTTKNPSAIKASQVAGIKQAQGSGEGCLWYGSSGIVCCGTYARSLVQTWGINYATKCGCGNTLGVTVPSKVGGKNVVCEAPFTWGLVGNKKKCTLPPASYEVYMEGTPGACCGGIGCIDTVYNVVITS